MSITSSAATMRVLSVLRHWVTKHGQVSKIEINTSLGIYFHISALMNKWMTWLKLLEFQDFEGNHHLKNLTIEFLEDIVCTRTLLPAEHKAASQLLRWDPGPPPLFSHQGQSMANFRMLTKEEPAYNFINLEELLTPTAVETKLLPSSIM